MKLVNIKNLTLRRLAIIVVLPIAIPLLIILSAYIGVLENFNGFWSDVRSCWSKS